MNTDAVREMDSVLHRFQEAAHDIRRVRATAAAQAKAEKRIGNVFTRQGGIFLRRFDVFRNRFSESVSDADIDPLFSDAEDATDGDMALALTDAATEGLIAGMGVATAQFNISTSFDLHNPRAAAYMKEHGAALVTKIDEETRNLIKTVLDDGINNGWSYGKIARMIHDRYDDMSVARAQRIAVYETGMAYEKGNAVVVRDLQDGGLEMEKSWLTVGDDKVEEECLANEADGWIPADEAHSSGDMEPLQHGGCRCSELYRMKGSVYE